MKIKSSYSDKDGSVDLDNNLDIIADDGRSLWCIRLQDDGSLEISSSGYACRHNDKMLDSNIRINPKDSARVVISREVYT